MQRSALCRSRRELSNEYLLAKIGFDTAENELCKVCPLLSLRTAASGEVEKAVAADIAALGVDWDSIAADVPTSHLRKLGDGPGEAR